MKENLNPYEKSQCKAIYSALAELPKKAQPQAMSMLLISINAFKAGYSAATPTKEAPQ